ncbi:UNVERIFIED_CONTAM: hypothetical protein FKN15_034864 [Acipenser sinensis]
MQEAAGRGRQSRGVGLPVMAVTRRVPEEEESPGIILLLKKVAEKKQLYEMCIKKRHYNQLKDLGDCEQDVSGVNKRQCPDQSSPKNVCVLISIIAKIIIINHPFTSDGIGGNTAGKAEPHQSPAREAEQDQSPAKGGDYTLLPPSSPGDHMLLPPPLLPPQEPEGEELQAPPPENFWGGEGQDAGVPQQPLFMLLKAARRAPAQPPQRREPAPPGAEELELPLPPVPPPQGGRWPEPQKGELPATKKGEEVWRPLSPAAVSLQEFLWPEPHKGELPAMKKGEVGGPPAPAAFSLQDGTSMLSAVPLPAGVLTAWPAMGPLKPPFPARDYVLDCWIFKGGGGR